MADPLELSLDTASEVASIALSRRGRAFAGHAWEAGREHGRQLLPAVDALLRKERVTKDDLTAVFVDIGPGSYAGLRAGVSTAKALAFALELPLVGVGRLEIEAYLPVHQADVQRDASVTVVALHRAGRRDIAWAAYRAGPEWRELRSPRLVRRDELLDALPAGALVTGEIDNELAAALAQRGHRVDPGAPERRAALLAELGWRRLQAGRTDDPKTLVPLYLREPAIGPQR